MTLSSHCEGRFINGYAVGLKDINNLYRAFKDREIYKIYENAANSYLVACRSINVGYVIILS